MAELKRCKKCGKIYSWNSYFNGYMCECGNIERRAITNADRIRAMSDDELADFITSQNRGICTDICREMYYKSNLEWLKQPAE